MSEFFATLFATVLTAALGLTVLVMALWTLVVVCRVAEFVLHLTGVLE